MPIALVIKAAGTNCDEEMVRAFALAGAEPTPFHVDAIIDEPALIDRADLIGFPGGFSYGDDVGSGRILAMKIRERLYPQLRDAARRGVPMIGACNGFQVMVQAGLLPGPMPDAGWPDRPAAPTVALAANADARFVDTWTPVTVEPDTACIWTRELIDSTAASDDLLMLPSAHGEGRFVAPDAVIDDLERTGRVALRYADNFNGSRGAIAGICDATGRILGLMPHPERYLDWNRHPYATRLDSSVRTGDTPGLRMFKNAVAAAVAEPARA